jgi:diguanylate cyclase (GGDEF)-like protein
VRKLGRKRGDALLKAIAGRLVGCARDCDTVVRLGGDEFAILMEFIQSSQDAEALARRLIETMQKPFLILDRELSISISIGTSSIGRHCRCGGYHPAIRASLNLIVANW